jgi:hypothetical protein
MAPSAFAVVLDELELLQAASGAAIVHAANAESTVRRLTSMVCLPFRSLDCQQ